MKKVTLKILVDHDRERIEDHAKQSLIRQRKAQERNGHVIPMNVPTANALFPNYCDECGGNFWANGEYAWHRGCPGKGNGRSFGFNNG